MNDDFYAEMKNLQEIPIKIDGVDSVIDNLFITNKKTPAIITIDTDASVADNKRVNFTIRCVSSDYYTNQTPVYIRGPLGKSRFDIEIPIVGDYMQIIIGGGTVS